MLIPLAGAMRIAIEGAPGLVTADCAALIPSGSLHRFEPNRDCKLLVLDVEASGASIGPDTGPSRFTTLEPWFLRVLRTIGRDVERDAGVARDAAQVALAGLRLLRVEHGPAAPQRHRRLRGVVRMVDGDPARRSISRLASEAALGRSQFHQLFRETTGRSPKQFQIERMLEAAVDRLVGTDDPVSTIARDCGYETVSSFNRLFKRHLGLSPTALRAGRS
jgi:AraC-like DNA-binding protein